MTCGRLAQTICGLTGLLRETKLISGGLLYSQWVYVVGAAKCCGCGPADTFAVILV
jgi:hypothetical protein